jgi:DNA polymerase III epsilon subunit-like protein
MREPLRGIPEILNALVAIPKLVAAVVDVETTGTNPDRDRIIELGICLFEYDRQDGRIYKVLGSWEWFKDPGANDPTGDHEYYRHYQSGGRGSPH